MGISKGIRTFYRLKKFKNLGVHAAQYCDPFIKLKKIKTMAILASEALLLEKKKSDPSEHLTWTHSLTNHRDTGGMFSASLLFNFSGSSCDQVYLSPS